MDFLPWYYSQGVPLYLKRWKFYLGFVVHYFSLPILVASLFSPWKRLVVVDERPGFSFKRFFDTLSFNLISRGIGAFVRVFLFITGLIILAFVALAGALGLLVWVVFPPLGIPLYLKYKERLEVLVEGWVGELKADPGSAVNIVLESEAGRFLLTHTGLQSGDFQSVKTEPLPGNFSAHAYREIMEWFVRYVSEDLLRKRGLTRKDLVLAASWWDQNKEREELLEEEKSKFGRPGVGLELLFGYTPTLNQFVVDLGVPQEFSHHLIGREEVVSQLERNLTSGNSAILVGSPGVGKRTVLLEFAHRAASGELGPQMAYRRVLEFDYNSILAESVDLNQKKTKLSLVFREAAQAGNIILTIPEIHRITNSEVEGYDFADVLVKFLEEEELKIIAVSSPAEYERFIAPNLRLRKYLEKVEVNPPNKDEAMLILMMGAQDWEGKKNLTFLVPALRQVLEASDKYITETPFPEKALELLDQVVTYAAQKGIKVVTVEEVNTILAEKTGVSFARITEQEKKKLGELEKIIHERLVNQDAAVTLIAKSLRARSVGVKSEKRPIGSFLFLGPTGVGKTETAKVLARVYYGSEKEILRFDMAEYAGREGLERLIGSVGKNQPGKLTTTIKNRPASLLLLDEIEKAPPEVTNLFLALLDEGVITDAFGNKINCQHLFVIATSNAVAENVRQLVSRGIKGEELQRAVVDEVQKRGLFSPEFLNRFDGVVVFEPLRQEHLVEIAKLMLGELSQKLKEKGIVIEVSSDAVEKIAQEGYEPAFGARPMRRIIELVLGDLVGKEILSGKIKDGDTVNIVPGKSKNEYYLEVGT